MGKFNAVKGVPVVSPDKVKIFNVAVSPASTPRVVVASDIFDAVTTVMESGVDARNIISVMEACDALVHISTVVRRENN